MRQWQDVLDTSIYFTVPGFKSPEIKVEHRRSFMYQWNSMSVFVPDISNGLTLKFYFGDDLIWVSETIDRLDLNIKSTSPRRKLSLKRPETQKRHFSMKTADGTLYIEYQGYIDGLLLKKVFLNVPQLTEQLAEAHHKVTCLIGGETFDEYAYLGRAQDITTNHKEVTRIYTWEAKKEESFPGIVLHRDSMEDLFNKNDDNNNNNLVEQYRDIDKMKLDLKATSDIHALLSFRNLKPMHKSYEYVMDNDDFRNDYRVLPINLKDRKVVVIRFYNFKFNPPRCTEIRIPRNEFIKSNIVTKKMDEIDGVLTIHHKDGMYIHSIILVVKDYPSNLNFIHDIELKTN